MPEFSRVLRVRPDGAEHLFTGPSVLHRLFLFSRLWWKV